jgi:hypothetical protein
VHKLCKHKAKSLHFVNAMPIDLKHSLEKLQARTKAGKLRGLMPTIEAKLKEGIRHVDIIRLLNEQGFKLSEHTYRSYLQRYRKKQAAAKKSPAVRARVSQGPVDRAGTPAPAPPTVGAGRRPPSFDYDPRGIPDLLK